MLALSKQISRLLCAGLLLVMAGAAIAQSAASYPNRAVRVIIPFAAGGINTLMLGVFGESLRKELGQTFVADYRPGADTAIGTEFAAKAAADGYTLLMTTSSFVVNHWLSPNLPFDSLKDLTPVAMLARANYVLLVHPSAPSTLKDFIALAKANPGKLNLSYSGSVSLLNYQMLMNAAGIKFTPIGFKGGPEAANSVLTGDSIGNLNTPGNVISLIKSGKLKALAITGDKRTPGLAEVPTFAEAGLREFNIYNWYALLAPSKTPRDIVEKLNAQFRKAQQAPEAVSMMENANIESFSTTVDETEKFISTEAAQYGKVIRESGLKAGN